MAHCWGVPMSRNSVLEGLRDKELVKSQLWIEFKVFDRCEKAERELVAEKEMKSWVSSA